MAHGDDAPRVLMIAYHYPPFAGSSGVQRALKFSRYLPDSGWRPIVLSISPRAYVETRTDQLAEVRDVQVVRAWGFDAARHLAVAGRYPRFVATPDRWGSWALCGIPAALWLARRYRVRALWSTYPIATAQRIALAVARATRLPWIADFRDSMTEPDYPRDPAQRAVFRALEDRVVHTASRVVMTTPGTVRMYRERYPDCPTERWRCIPNGYDEEDFAASRAPLPGAAGTPIVLLHSGALYPIERDPTALFGALAELRDAGHVARADFRLRLRATGHDVEIAALIARFTLGDLVELAPGIGYRDAVAEMTSADALLILQAANCNHQIPAKLYEYLRTGRPILALTDPAGDTGRALVAAGIHTIAPLDDQRAIKTTLAQFIAALRAGAARGATVEVAQQYSRRAQCRHLAEMLSEITR